MAWILSLLSSQKGARSLSFLNMQPLHLRMVRLLQKNAFVGMTGLLLSYGFWLSRPQWDPEMRFWRAVGDASLILLVIALVLGPSARIWPGRISKWLTYRREFGVWFGLYALLHTVLIFNGWARWSVMRFLGYEFVPQLGRLARLEPGFGLSNLIGLVAVLFTIVLMVTSTDWAVRWLGGAAWKFLQYGAYTVFYLVALHTAYFLFLHYTESFHRSVPDDPNWFRFPFLFLTLLVMGLQLAAFAKAVGSARRGTRRQGIDSTSSPSTGSLLQGGGKKRKPRTAHRPGEEL